MTDSSKQAANARADAIKMLEQWGGIGALALVIIGADRKNGTLWASSGEATDERLLRELRSAIDAIEDEDAA